LIEKPRSGGESHGVGGIAFVSQFDFPFSLTDRVAEIRKSNPDFSF